MLKIRLHAAMQHHAQNTDVTLQKCLYVCSKAESFKHVADYVAIQNLCPTT